MLAINGLWREFGITYADIKPQDSAEDRLMPKADEPCEIAKTVDLKTTPLKEAEVSAQKTVYEVCGIIPNQEVSDLAKMVEKAAMRIRDLIYQAVRDGVRDGLND